MKEKMRPRCFSFTQCGISFFTWKAVGSLYGILQLFYNFYQNICLLLLWIPFSFLLRFRKYLVPLIEGCFGIYLSLAPWLTCVRFVDNLCHSLTVRVDFRFDNALALSSSKNFCITCFLVTLHTRLGERQLLRVIVRKLHRLVLCVSAVFMILSY